MEYIAKRPSAVARRKKENRRAFIKSIIATAVAIPLLWAMVWLAYFATI